MAKLTLADLASLANETSAINTINSNNTLTETALENTLSRDGTTPNTMTADIDLNSNDLLNVGVVNASQIKVGGVDAALLGDVTVRGAWVTATAYAQLDLVTESGNTYFCLEAHTSGTFATDLAAAKWTIIEASYDPANVAITGGTIAGAVTLDGVAANTLVNDTDIGSTVQAFDTDTLIGDTSATLTAKFTETPILDSGTGTVTVDFSTRSKTTFELTGDITTLNITGIADGDICEIWFRQDTTDRTVSGWASSGNTFFWSGAAEPTIVAGTNNVTVVQLRYDSGTLTIYGNSVDYSL